MLARAGYWLAGTALLFVLWLLFAGRDPHELIAGAGAAALAAMAVEAVRGTEHPQFLPAIAWVLRAWRLPGQILRDCWLLLRNLTTGRDGRFVREPFDAGGDDARSAAHRALETLYRTLPPNSIVIGIDRERHELLLHVLEGEA
jgi:multisubunit Na+/H+ antiporter MnhE subunit